MNNLELRTVRSLQGMSFFVPSYQRGYRWTSQQVTDLLDDIEDFRKSIGNDAEGFYCIQPLVVKEMLSESVKTRFLEEIQNLKVSDDNVFEQAKDILHRYSKWEVIDGQQRLTTIFLILKYLNEDSYSIEYDTRQNENTDSSITTKSFLDDIEKEYTREHIYDTIDFHHFHIAFENIKKWFDEKGEMEKQNFKSTLLDNVQFIWYKADDEDPIKVFTRLNIGKISLTNAELIKAMFLNRSNFTGLIDEQLISKQTEIASQWDRTEYALQNDDLWLFIHEKDYNRPTRIDFLFDLICDQNLLGIDTIKLGKDDYKTFRYFDKYFKKKKKEGENGLKTIETCWNHVMNLYNIIDEWYNDIILYHYIGFLISSGEPLTKYINLWREAKSKKDFIEGWKDDNKQIYGLKQIIKDKISRCYDHEKGLEHTVYEIEEGFGPKNKCKNLLLLHNVLTVISQNSELESHMGYQQGVFYKFPFHLYKKESWDIEHVDSNTENPLTNPKDQKEWLKYAIIGHEFSDDLLSRIADFLNKPKKDISIDDFMKLRKEILKEVFPEEEKWDEPDLDKNKIWNYVLLDSNTNRGYGNSIFPAKRRSIIGKDRGIKYVVDLENGVANIHPTKEEEIELHSLMEMMNRNDSQEKRLNELKKYSAVSFIPPCTRNVFMKYYTKAPNNLLSWGQTDAKSYMENLLILLHEFIDVKEG